jgi:uncharacterized hydrophobic protein (TIGR00271 family)
VTQIQQDETPEIKPTEREWKLLRRSFDVLRSYFARLLRVSEDRKPQIYAEVFRSSDLFDLNYWLEIIFSLGIATLGLIINSPAVVIGAMLVSPLMGPIIANGLALALGDFYLGTKAFVNLVLSVVVSVTLAAFITWILPFHSATPEILARVQPTLLDLGVAILSGMAGAVVICRGGQGGGITALPGVAVAVALMPPLAVVGFGVGIGWDWQIVSGGGLLFLTNLVAIILSSFLVFFAVRMDAPAVRREINEFLEARKKEELLFEIIDRTPLRRLLGRVGSLPRRLLIMLIFLASVAWPLQKTLDQLRQEAFLRRVVLEELYKAIPREDIFREDLSLSGEVIRLRVVAVLPGGFASGKRTEMERLIRARTQRQVQVTVFDVPTREEVTELTGRLTPAAAQPVIETIDEIRTKLVTRVRPAVAAAWPMDRAPLAGFTVSFGPNSPALHLRIVYLSEQELGELGEEAVRRAVRDRLSTPGVELSFERLSPQARLTFSGRGEGLPADAKEQLDAVAVALARFPALKCSVAVQAPEGAEPSSLQKSRAENVRKYLVEEKKVAADRISLENTAGDAGSLGVRLVPPPQS